MKMIRKIAVAIVMFAVVFTTANVQAAVPCTYIPTANMQAAVPCIYTPYANIEYEYVPAVTCGTLRYIGQNTGSSQYHAQYWGNYTASSECLTANISMALSYVGANVTPKDILDFSTNTTWQRNWGGITSYAETTFENAMNNYINGAGKYSPPIIHLTGENCGYSRGHYVIVVGKISDTQYQVLDPYCDTVNQPLWQISIVDGIISYTLSAGTRQCSSALSTAYQYYNENAVIGQTTPGTGGNDANGDTQPTGDTETINQEPVTIEGANYPESIVEGQAFSIKGIIKSQTNLTNVAVLVVNSAGEPVISVTAQPNTTSYDIFKEMDKSVTFGKLSAGKYTYIVKASNDSGETTLVSEEFTVKPKAASIVSAVNCSSGITITWKKSESATGYYVYRKEVGGKFKRIAEVAGSDNVSFIDKSTSKGTKYAYKVYVYKDDAGVRINSAASSAKVCFRIVEPTSFTIKKVSSKSIKVTYKKVTKATSYQIQYSTSKNFASTRTISLTGTSKTISSLKKGKTYYVRVRTCYKSGRVVYRSAWTTAKKIKL